MAGGRLPPEHRALVASRSSPLGNVIFTTGHTTKHLSLYLGFCVQDCAANYTTQHLTFCLGCFVSWVTANIFDHFFLAGSLQVISDYTTKHLFFYLGFVVQVCAAYTIKHLTFCLGCLVSQVIANNTIKHLIDHFLGILVVFVRVIANDTT